jgi:hypothetical protein
MRMPNGQRAVVDMLKLTDYCLNENHPRGRHKARVFASVLGITPVNAEVLRDALLAATMNDTAVPADQDEYGQRYTLDLTVTGPAGQAQVRSGWIIRTGEDFPRLTSCYVLS